MIQTKQVLQNCPVFQNLQNRLVLCSSDDDSSDNNAVQPKTGKGRAFSVSRKERAMQARMQAERGKDLSFRRRFGMLPTANNRSNKSNTTGLDTQYEYHHISQHLLATNFQKTWVY